MKKALQLILYLVAAYHILLGLVGIFFKGYAVEAAKLFFSFNLTLTPEIYWILNPFAAYVLFFGIFMVVAATDPLKYRNIIYVGVGLFALRIIQRLFFAFTASADLISVVNPAQNILHIVVVAILGVAMLGMVKSLK